MFNANPGMGEDEFEDLLGGDTGRGALVHWKLLESYDASSELLEQVFTFRNEKVADIKETLNGDHVHEDDLKFLFTYTDMACSSATVGTIAPLIDTLLNPPPGSGRSVSVRAEESSRQSETARRASHLVQEIPGRAKGGLP